MLFPFNSISKRMRKKEVCFWEVVTIKAILCRSRFLSTKVTKAFDVYLSVHRLDKWRRRTNYMLLRPGTHYPHVTWAYVMLRVQLGYLTLNSGADPHFCHSAYVTWSDVSRVTEVGLRQNSMLNIPTTLVISRKLTWHEDSVSTALVFYYTYDRLNMFQAPLCSSSGAHDYTVDCHIDRLVLRLLEVRCGQAG
jgi:hypothetical protein